MQTRLQDFVPDLLRSRARDGQTSTIYLTSQQATPVPNLLTASHPRIFFAFIHNTQYRLLITSISIVPSATQTSRYHRTFSHNRVLDKSTNLTSAPLSFDSLCPPGTSYPTDSPCVSSPDLARDFLSPFPPRSSVTAAVLVPNPVQHPGCSLYRDMFDLDVDLWQEKTTTRRQFQGEEVFRCCAYCS